jgi:hypothetical protein
MKYVLQIRFNGAHAARVGGTVEGRPVVER